MKRKKILLMIAGFFYLVFLADLEGMIRGRSRASVLSGDVLKSEEFREQKLSADLYKQLHKVSGDTEDWIPLLAASMAEEDFYPEKISNNQELYRKYKPEEFQLLLCCAEGTRYAGMIDEMVEIEVEATHRYQESLDSVGRPSPEIDSMLEHMLATGMFNTYFEMFIHQMPLDQAKIYLKTMHEFYTAGWMKILKQ